MRERKERGHVWRVDRYSERRAVGDGKGGGRREERGMEGDSTGIGG